MDKTWDCICRIILAAEELKHCGRYIDNQESLILRDAREMIAETVDDNLIRHMKDAA